MRKLPLTIVLLLLAATQSNSQQLERFAFSLPVFAAYCGVRAVDNTLTVGVFSEKEEIPQSILDVFKNAKPWKKESVVDKIKHERVEVVSLNPENLEDFDGQIIWVLDADFSSNLLKEKTRANIFTIGAQNPTAFVTNLFTTVVYKNVSQDQGVEKWRLERLIANCEISKLRYPPNVTEKPYFEGIDCD